MVVIKAREQVTKQNFKSCNLHPLGLRVEQQLIHAVELGGLKPGHSPLPSQLFSVGGKEQLYYVVPTVPDLGHVDSCYWVFYWWLTEEAETG